MIDLRVFIIFVCLIFVNDVEVSCCCKKRDVCNNVIFFPNWTIMGGGCKSMSDQQGSSTVPYYDCSSINIRNERIVKQIAAFDRNKHMNVFFYSLELGLVNQSCSVLKTMIGSKNKAEKCIGFYAIQVFNDLLRQLEHIAGKTTVFDKCDWCAHIKQRHSNICFVKPITDNEKSAVLDTDCGSQLQRIDNSLYKCLQNGLGDLICNSLRSRAKVSAMRLKDRHCDISALIILKSILSQEKNNDDAAKCINSLLDKIKYMYGINYGNKKNISKNEKIDDDKLKLLLDAGILDNKGVDFIKADVSSAVKL